MNTPSTHMKPGHWLLLLLTITLLGCGPGKGNILCILRNPTTGAHVEMYRELPFKVPAGYDEKKHIEQWKAEQRAKGFTEIVEE